MGNPPEGVGGTMLRTSREVVAFGYAGLRKMGWQSMSRLNSLT
jgi:hypothetical protein